MATQYTDILKLALPTTGELSGTWGDVVNDNITSMIEEAIAGLATINSWTTNTHTLTTADGTTSESRAAILELDDDGSGNPNAAAEVICPAETKVYIVNNGCGQTATVKTSGGTGIAIPDGKTAVVYCDGTNVVEATNYLPSLVLGTDLAIADGGTGASTASNARDNLGLTIGTDVQAHDAGLDSISNLTTAANKMIYTTASDTYAVTDLTAAGRAILDDADAAAQRTTLGLGTAAVQDDDRYAQVANNLDDLADAATARTNLGLGTAAVQDDDRYAQVANNLDDLADAATARTNLGLAIGTDVQAYDADTAKLDTAQTWAANQNLADYLLQRPTLKDYAIEGSAIGNTGAAQTFDLETANFFTATLDQASTFTFSNPPGSGDFGGFVLALTNGGAFTITWPASVDWAGGNAPTLTSSGLDILVFVTYDAGTTWHGVVSSLDSK